MDKYKVIYADPPWDMGKMGSGKDKKRPGRKAPIGGGIIVTPYPIMSVDEICNLNIQELADDECHLWLWATNRTLHDAFHVMDAWGFKYLNIITYYKPNGIGAWFVNRTQHLLFGYRGKLKMGEGRYAPTIQKFRPMKHSQKPQSTYELIESISPEPRLELFARSKRNGWDVWGNEIESDIDLLNQEQ